MKLNRPLRALQYREIRQEVPHSVPLTAVFLILKSLHEKVEHCWKGHGPSFLVTESLRKRRFSSHSKCSCQIK